MAKGRNEQIPDINTGWKDYAGKWVEEFIKRTLNSKVGFLHRPQEKGSDNCYHVLGFADEASFNDWNSNPDENSALLLTDIALPETGGGASTAVSYIVGLYSNSPNTIVTTDNTVKLQIRFTSEEFNPITQTTQGTSENGTLTVQTRLNSSASWVTRGTIENVPSMTQNDTEWTEIDITNLVNNGSQQVRLIVKGDTTELNTRYLQFNVTKTSLGMTFATQWERPITDGVMRLSFYVNGAVSKTINIRIDGSRLVTRDVGTAVYTETPVQFDVIDTAIEPIKVLTHGIHDIEAWISVNDSNIESEHIHAQVLVIADDTDETPYLVLNNIKDTLTNWTSERILTYAVYKKNASTLPLKFVFGDYNGNTEYMALDMGEVAVGTRYALNNVIEIDSEAQTIDAYMRFYSGASEIHTMLGFSVDNRENFSPVRNPDFVLNPRTRTNDESHPNSIINGADNTTVIPSTWRNFGFKRDGWVEDEDGNRCLRVLAGRELTIDYEYLSAFLSNERSSVTVEYDFATRNATDTDIPVLRMCSYDGENNPLGFEMKPWEACFMTSGKKVRRDQDVMFREGVRTHMALNIIRGINGTLKNYVRIFINGKINREFEWADTDNFVQFVNGVKTSQGIRIGSDYCDIDLYGMRIYKRSLSATDIRQDRMAALPTVAEKIAFREANDILNDSNLISYAKTRELYNTMVIRGSVPSYASGDITTYADVDINIIGDLAHSGTLFGMEISGQGTSSKSYWKWNFTFKFGSEGYWMDGNGVNHGKGYQLDDTVPMAEKLVGKLNWASSQQSHKLGSCNLYTDLWRICTGGSSITATPGFENARVTIKQKPFFVFVQQDEGAEPVFYGLYTFGPGKGDKPTFGYDKTVFPSYLMLEGCDNGEPLVNHRIPWNEDIEIFEKMKNNKVDDVFVMFNGAKQWELTLGDKSASNPSFDIFKDAFNFVYLLNPHIKPFVGTIEGLQVADESVADRQCFYWVTQASGSTSKFDLFRYDVLTSRWVNAGVAKYGAGNYARFNLSQQLGITPTGNVWNDINAQFVNARVAKFVEQAHNYFKLDDAFFTMMFLKLIAASDNRAKNTYLYLAMHNGRMVIHFAQDDLDTIMLSDNVGRKKKPYYVEEHDPDPEGGTYWNGEMNAMCDLFEMGFPEQLRTMMRNILTAMASLSSDHTLLGCMEDYYFAVQRYFPAVAYNETARLLYEEAASRWGLPKSEGGYTASTHPIAQSLGDQLEGELQWMKLRLIYLSSWASYGEFTMNGENSLTFRSVVNLQGSAPTYSFDLTPHMWIYPAVSAGSSTFWGRGKSAPQRVPAGETYTLDGISADGNTNIQIHGIHYFRKIGEFGNKPLQETFVVAGERLTEFVADSNPAEFRPNALEVTAPNLRKLVVKNVPTIGGVVDLTKQSMLEEFNMQGTGITGFVMAEPTSVKKLMLPGGLTSLSLDGYKNLPSSGYAAEGYGSLQTLVFNNCPNLDSKDLIAAILDENPADFNACRITGINWERFSLTYLEKLANIRADLQGEISLISTDIVTFALKKKLVEAWGDIDSEGNKLRLIYTPRSLSSITVSGQRYIGRPGKYKLDLTPNNANANDFKGVTWSIVANSFATIDPRTGELTVTQVGTEERAPKALVTATVTKLDGSTVSDTIEIGLYERSCKVGDLVYADGTFSDYLDNSKTVVGVCFYIDPDNPIPGRRLCVACDNQASDQWGLYQEGSNGNNGFSAITLEDNPGYSCFDIPTMVNVGSSGLSGNYVNESTYRNETSTGDADGFKVLSASVAAGEIGFRQLTAKLGKHEIGEYLPYGLINTLRIIDHRDVILNDSAVNLPLPQAVGSRTMFNNLNELMTNVVSENGKSKYRQFYYPAASLCNAYEPGIKAGETLADCFKQGNWFLPSAGELARIYWWHHFGYTVGAENAIFANAANLGRFTSPGTSYFWSSTEGSSNYAWGVGFSNGDVGGYNGKSYTIVVRAVAAF